MDNLRDKQKVKRRLYSRTSRVVLFIVLVIFVRATWNIYVKQVESADNVVKAERERDALAAKQAELSAKVQDLETGEGQDQAIREKFGVAKEGETLVMIVRGKESTPTTTPEARRSWWGTVWAGVAHMFVSQ